MSNLVRELAGIADYITRLRREIGALRANEFSRDRIPMAHEELGSVVSATASATNTIMASAEAILALPPSPPAAYRSGVEHHINDIFEACAFQDITGQRIARVAEALELLERRLSHFAEAVNARDHKDEVDPAEAAREERRQTLLLNGPQAPEAATSQDEIDALFG